MDEIARKKAQLRKKLRALREELGPERRASIDSAIAQRVCSHPAYDQASAVFTYLSIGAEVDTRAIIRDAWSKGKLVAVPRCIPHTSSMEWYRIDDFDNVETSSFGIEEPPANPERLVDLAQFDTSCALTLVPGLSFDANGFRLGYGGGFYDEFLPQFKGTSLGLCRPEQFSDTPLPRREADVSVDEVVASSL